ncbi:MAG: DUF2064 domain-containing protein [Paracoccaceae bacterium]
MLKEPRPGRVKTRLGRDIGMVRAAWWFRHQSARLLRRLTLDPRWQTVLAVSPDHAGMISRVWPPAIARWPQGRGNLGARMGRVFRRMPPGPVVIIGADIPGIGRGHVARAFGLLGTHDAVFGPADDGGYWLVGMKRAAPLPGTLFDGVRWSGRHALGDTIRSMPGLKIGFLEQLRDVDEAADLQ